MKKMLSLVLVLALCLLASSAMAETIKLGGLAPLTGNYAEYGKGFEIGWPTSRRPAASRAATS